MKNPDDLLAPQRDLGDATTAFMRDDLEMQRATADQHTQGDESREAAAACESVEAGRDLPGSGHPHDLDIGRCNPMRPQHSLGSREQPIDDRAVETRRDDAETPPGAVQK